LSLKNNVHIHYRGNFARKYLKSFSRSLRVILLLAFFKAPFDQNVRNTVHTIWAENPNDSKAKSMPICEKVSERNEKRLKN